MGGQVVYGTKAETAGLGLHVKGLTAETKDFNLAAVIGILVFLICSLGSLIAFNLSKASKNEEEFS